MLLFGIVALVLRRRRGAVVLSQVLLGIVFIAAGSTKIFEPEKLSVIIDAYRIMPHEFVSFAAIASGSKSPVVMIAFYAAVGWLWLWHTIVLARIRALAVHA